MGSNPGKTQFKRSGSPSLMDKIPFLVVMDSIRFNVIH